MTTRSSNESSSGFVLRLFGLLLVFAFLSACGARSTDALLDQAKTALSKQDIKTAEIHLKNLLQQQPDNPDARIMLAEVHRANRDERSAEKEWRRALELGVAPDRALPGLMESLVTMGEGKDALDAAGKYSAAQPEGKAAVAYWSGPQSRKLGVSLNPTFPYLLMILERLKAS